jgi:hypothetical protein
MRNLDISATASVASNPMASVDMGLLAGMNNGTVLLVNTSATVVSGEPEASASPLTKERSPSHSQRAW